MVNYHGHTYRCGHAEGNDEEYIIKAIDAGFEAIGFSDHVMIPNCIQPNIRADYSYKNEYFKSIKELKEKYKKRITIYLSFECEYNERFVDYYKSLLNEVDYLIFGNHCSNLKELDNGEYTFTYEYNSIEDYLDWYFENSKKALESGLFKIFAHPDLFMCRVTKWNEYLEKKTYEICKIAKDNNVALEFNQACFNHDKKRVMGEEFRYRYPYKRFFEIAKEVGNTIVIGIDAHSPKDYVNYKGRRLVEDFAKEIGLTITDKLDNIG